MRQKTEELELLFRLREVSGRGKNGGRVEV